MNHRLVGDPCVRSKVEPRGPCSFGLFMALINDDPLEGERFQLTVSRSDAAKPRKVNVFLVVSLYECRLA